MNIDENIEKLLNCSKSKLIFLYIYQNKKIDAIRIIKEYIECSDEDIEYILQTFFVRYNENIKNSDNNHLAKELQNKPQCPYCKSNNTKKISTTSRVISTTLFGIASKKLGKQFHCNQCGADF